MHKSNKVHESLEMILFYEPHVGCLSRGSQLEHKATLQTRLLQEEMLVVFDQSKHILLKEVDCVTSWQWFPSPISKIVIEETSLMIKFSWYAPWTIQKCSILLYSHVKKAIINLFYHYELMSFLFLRNNLLLCGVAVCEQRLFLVYPQFNGILWHRKCLLVAWTGQFIFF